MKKFLALLLAVIMLVTCMAGCGKTDTPADKPADNSADKPADGEAPAAAAGTELPLKELSLPLCEEKQELTVWLAYSGTVMKDLNEIEGVKKMEELTNVHINWIPVNQDDMVQKFGTLIASGDLPDIIYPNSYPGGYEAGVEDGVINPDMDYYIRNYMPNYMALLASNEQLKREATSDSGKMLVCKCIVGQANTVESEGTYQGLAYRADLLEKLGLDVPTTIDEWHDALVAAKEAGIPYPFVLDNDGGSALACSWGVGTQNLYEFLQVENDKIVCGPAKDSWKGYLDTMKQWYSEGLINPNFPTFHFYLDTPASVQNNETLLYSMVLSAFTGNNYAVSDEDFHAFITHYLQDHGWDVVDVYIGHTMQPLERMLLINRMLKGRARNKILINEENNEDLLLSLRSAGVYNGRKDKRGEKLAETEEDRLEGRTDGSDAADTLWVGMEKFPMDYSGTQVISLL